MSNEHNLRANFLGSDVEPAENSLINYIQTLQPEAVSKLSKPDTEEVLRLMEQNITGLLGNIPQGAFNVQITTDRENLGRLLASAMMGGYFLRNAEQRFAFERSLQTMMSTDAQAEDSASSKGSLGASSPHASDGEARA